MIKSTFILSHPPNSCHRSSGFLPISLSYSCNCPVCRISKKEKSLTACSCGTRFLHKRLAECRSPVNTVTIAIIQARSTGSEFTRATLAYSRNATCKKVDSISRSRETSAVLGDVVTARRIRKTNGNHAIEEAAGRGGDNWKGSDGVWGGVVRRGCHCC